MAGGRGLGGAELHSMNCGDMANVFESAGRGDSVDESGKREREGGREGQREGKREGGREERVTWQSHGSKHNIHVFTISLRSEYVHTHSITVSVLPF